MSEHSREEIEDWICEKISAAAGMPVKEIDVTQPFATFGVDSMTAAGLSGELEEWLGLSLAPTLLWDYPTIEALAEHLSRQTGARE